MVPSWYHTLLFRQYPGYCTDDISARNHTFHRTIELRSSGPPRSSRSGAKPSCNSPRRSSKSGVTIYCYSEKRSRPSQWSGGAPTGARAWGALQWQYERQDKNRLHSRNRSIFFGPEARTISTNRSPLAQSFEHASIYSPSIRSPHGSANRYASMETYLMFALYLLRSIGSLEQFGTRPRSSYERACQDRGRSFRFCFLLLFSHVCVPS